MKSIFLIAHIVRGEQAYDIASRSPCMFCQGYETITDEFIPPTTPTEDCDYCDSGFTWIIPTSGHRAFPYWFIPLTAVAPEAPKNWPDHYHTSAAPVIKPIDLQNIIARLSPPKEPFRRRV